MGVAGEWWKTGIPSGENLRMDWEKFGEVEDNEG
jgi:hypothetical protein